MCSKCNGEGVVKDENGVWIKDCSCLLRPLKIYISGPMTGIEDFNYPKFDRIEKELKEQGFEVVNPASIGRELVAREVIKDSMSDEIKTQVYMKHDLIGLLECDSIFMMNGWMDSKGAFIEYNVALVTGHRFFYEELL